MDINAASFLGNLLDIFTAISESQFVSFDLELSGIPSKQWRPNGNKQTLQERYEEVKHAAERYQILQIGLTCVREVNRPVRSGESPDMEIVYGVQPYNFNLSPLLPERMGVERIFSFQSGAAQFLIEHGFRMDLPFTHGVPYLSRDEAKLVKATAYAKIEERGALPDIDLSKPEDVAAVDFMEDVRRAIKAWQKSGKPQADYLDIDPKTRNTPKEDRQAELSKFEMRLVHQLVRAEFPNLKSLGKRSFVQIVHLSEARELAYRKERKRQIKERIAEQTGFRWIIEWMTCGDMSKLDAKSFARSPSTGDAIYADLDYLTSRLHRARDRMGQRRTVLVGHNLFTDLIYLYRTFIGPLPETVEEHARNIHELFPRVIDTKYMATHNAGRIKPDSSLDGLGWSLAQQSSPIIVTHPHHEKYIAGAAYHEAGYDSLLTAQVLIRLSTKLEALGRYIDDPTTTDGKTSSVIEDPPVGEDAEGRSDDSYATAQEDSSGIAGLLSNSLSIAGSTVSNVKDSLFGGPSSAYAEPANGPTKKKKRKSKSKKKKAATQTVSRFSQPNIFDRLQDLPEDYEGPEIEEEVVPDTSFAKDTPIPVTSSPDAAVASPTETRAPELPEDIPKATLATFVPAHLSNREVKLSTKMPPWKSDFWRVYTNKLRVFGTEEEVCILDAE